MALDLLERRPVWDADLGAGVEASLLLKYLCLEAGVCRHDEVYGNLVRIDAATVDVQDGLRVTDAQGKVWRLRVTAEEVSG